MCSSQNDSVGWVPFWLQVQFPVRGHMQGCRLNPPQGAYRRQLIHILLSHGCFSPFPFLCLKINENIFKEGISRYIHFNMMCTYIWVIIDVCIHKNEVETVPISLEAGRSALPHPPIITCTHTFDDTLFILMRSFSFLLVFS